jgi:hypothetical protein
MVVSFGTLFNNIRLVKYNRAGTQEIERINVPLQYAQKEKFFQRITQDPDLTRQIEIALPRMSFELDSITYDPLRKLGLFAERFSPNSSTSVNSVRATPYNFVFSLSIYVRNTEDGTQIIEQILPYFNPDYNLTIDILGSPNQKVDVPFILDNISYQVEDVGSPEQLRVLIWTLTFTAKGYMFGPISSKSVIRKVTANTYDTLTYDSTRSITVTNTDGIGIFKTGELVYQGRTLESATATAFVDGWESDSFRLFVSDVNGVLKTGEFLTGAVSNASYNVVSFGSGDFQLSKIQVTPDPSSANANSAFGFDVVIQEFPNIT